MDLVQPWLIDPSISRHGSCADDALLRRVALPIGLALVAPELRRGPFGNPGGWRWDGHGPWHPRVQISSTILRRRINSLTMGSDSCIPGGCHMDLHYRYEWGCFAVWLGCKWVSQYFIYFPSEFAFYWPFTLWIKNAGWINHPSPAEPLPFYPNGAGTQVLVLLSAERSIFCGCPRHFQSWSWNHPISWTFIDCI